MAVALYSTFVLPVVVALAYIFGIASGIWLLPLMKRALIYLFTLNTSADNKNNVSTPGRLTQDNTSLYGLDHAVLNIEFPPTTMWMNMGYWEDEKTVQLPEACEALLEKVLSSAGLHADGERTNKPTLDAAKSLGNASSKRRKVLLDVGIGCGEQTMYLMMNSAGLSPRFDEYIGVTLDKVQHGFAQRRLQENIVFLNQHAVGGVETQDAGRKISLFCADAARPYQWPDTLKKAVTSAFGDDTNTERYVLGLDTLYHFHPSRRELFKYTHSTLHANILAFDLFLAPSKSSGLRQTLNSLFLRLLTPALGAPFNNFVTSNEYKAQLEEAGYSASNILIEDITHNVFGGLANFLDTRNQEMAGMGLTGFTKWQIAGWLFKWLSSGHILRAGIVIARYK